MDKLVEAGLHHGNLMEVSSPAMAARYNRALEMLTGHSTSLEKFHIDQVGYSPEVATEIGEEAYLNPAGCNRKFILLSVDQEPLPVLTARFTTTRSVMRKFMRANRKTLFALTARDAAVGEIDNSTWRLDSPLDVLGIRELRVDVDTPRGLIGSSFDLEEMVEAFRDSNDLWHDDATIGRMVELARDVGDVRRTRLACDTVRFEQGDFHTDHFGGLWVFRDAVSAPTVVMADPETACEGDVAGLESEMSERGYAAAHLQRREELAVFLRDEGLVDFLPLRRNSEDLRRIRRKMDFLMVDAASRHMSEEEMARVRREDLKRHVHAHAGAMPDLFWELAEVVKRVENDGEAEAPRPSDETFFSLAVPSGKGDEETVEHLLATCDPSDVLRRYVADKDGFFADYQTWTDAKKRWVVGYLADQYLPDKEAARADMRAVGGHLGEKEAESKSVAIQVSRRAHRKPFRGVPNFDEKPSWPRG